MSINTTNVVDTYNPLISAAKPLLSLANAMKKTNSNLTVEQLIYKLSGLVEEFEEKAESLRASFDSIRDAKYCLCTFIDETGVRSEWANEEWARKSLLVTFFDETWGGEGFFEILDRATKDPDKNIYLLELIYLFLQFGYKGQYQIRNEGDVEIAKYKTLLEKTIRNSRPNLLDSLFIPTEIASNQVKEKKWYDIPIWMIMGICIALCTFMFMFFHWSLGNTFDLTSTKVNSLTLPKIPSYQIKAEITSPKIAPLLQHKIVSEDITVIDSGDKSVITILGDGIFESGSEKIKDEYFATFALIGQELDNISGKIVVSGYTDNRPINSIEYPSNWHLSQSRADMVKQILVDKNDGYIKDASRVRSEGMGENNPVVSNDTPANRAKNRRVEITIYHNSKYPVKKNTNDIAGPEATSDIAGPEATNDIARPEATNDIARPEVTNDIARPEVTNDIARPEVTNF